MLNLSQSPRPTPARGALPTTRPGALPPAIVLDTNVVLDWLVFADPSSGPLAAAIQLHRVRWLATAAMRRELAEVLRRGVGADRGTDPAVALAAWDGHVELRQVAPRLPATVPLHCSDAADQKFLDLAHAAGTRWLLSRDRAVLRLARRATAFGIAITVPESWSAPG